MLITASCDITMSNPKSVAIGFVSQDRYTTTSNVVESVIPALKYIIDGVLPTIEDIHGYWAEFYYPDVMKQDDVHEESFYGAYSDDFSYVRKPNKRKKVTVTGLMVNRFLSGEGAMDGYFAPPPRIFMTGDEKFPENTHVRLFVGSTRYLDFQIDRQEAIYGVDDILMTELILIPVAAPK